LLVEWRPARSRLAGVALVVSVAVVFCSLFFVTPVDLWQWLVVTVLLGLLVRAFVRDWRREPQDFGLHQGQWYLLQQGQRLPVTLRHSHFISHRIGVIGFATANGDTVAITILPDSLSADDGRKLAVALA
jgi:hypothetical protein